jgi:hypothetical protein
MSHLIGRVDCSTSTKMQVLVEDTDDIHLRGLHSFGSLDDGRICHNLRILLAVMPTLAPPSMKRHWCV